MADTNNPVVIEHQPDSGQSHEKKSSYIKDSASRILNIAQCHGLDALLQNEPPQKTPLHP